VPLGGRSLTRAVVLADLGVKYSLQLLVVLDLQRFGVGAKVDGIAAPAICLAADGTVAALIWLGRVAVAGEADGSAAAGTFKVEGHFRDLASKQAGVFAQTA
jgi:hypothetical protein